MSDLIEIPVFTPYTAKIIADRVKALPQYHVNRGGFYTLGAATYQDDPYAYPAIANAFNPIIQSNFPAVLQTVYDVLAAHFDRPVGTFTAGVGLPSFHIFDQQCNGIEGHPHIDEPFTRINLGSLDWSDPFSFTIPVELPAGGGGIDFWWGCTDAEVEKYMAGGEVPKPTYHPYTVGALYMHDGMTPHRIANPCDMVAGEHRITLQGHGIHVEGGALVYF